MDWKTSKLDDVLISIIGGGTPSKSRPEYWHGDIPWASVKDMADDKFRLSATKDYITQEGLDNSATNLIPKGTVITATRMGLGRCFINQVDMSINQDLKALIPNDKINNDFLLWLVVSKSSELENLGTGTTVKGIRLEDLRSLEFLLPPLPTQQKIASILSAYDDLIENNNRRISILEEMAQKLYREWFVKFRFPGHEDVKMVDSELGEIPEGWEVVSVSNAMDINPRTTLAREGDKPYIGMSYLSENSMVIKGNEYRSGNSGTKFKNSDTLFARITPSLENGKTGYVQFLDDENPIGFGSTEFIVLRSKTLTPEYVYCLARSENFRANAIKSMTGATGRQRVQNSCFDNYFFAQPSEDALKQFTNIVRPMFELINSLHRKNLNLRQQRDLLLPKLISGKLNISKMENI